MYEFGGQVLPLERAWCAPLRTELAGKPAMGAPLKESFCWYRRYFQGC